MWHFLYHWIYRDVWCVTYPNWIASGVVVVLAYVYGKKELLKIHRKLDLHHAQHMAALNKSIIKAKEK
jgi:hypothetical protein